MLANNSANIIEEMSENKTKQQDFEAKIRVFRDTGIA